MSTKRTKKEPGIGDYIRFLATRGIIEPHIVVSEPGRCFTTEDGKHYLARFTFTNAEGERKAQVFGSCRDISAYREDAYGGPTPYAWFVRCLLTLKAAGAHKCSRCGGEGGWKGWPGYTCYRCYGTGSDPDFLKDAAKAVKASEKAAKVAANLVIAPIKGLKTVPIEQLNVVAVLFQTGSEQDEETGREFPEFEVEVYDNAAYDRSGGIPSKPVRCDCCGHSLKYACLIEHTPTATFYNVGRDCAAKIEWLKNSLDRVEGSSVALAERALCNAREQGFRKAHPEAVNALDWAKAGTNKTGLDLAQKLRSYGLSDKQATFLVKLHIDDTTRRASATGEAPTGRQTVSGTVLSAKPVESEFGTTIKTLIDLGNGAKVYGNAPGDQQPERGQKVTFTGTFEQSKNDKLFGFWKRPSKWLVK